MKNYGKLAKPLSDMLKSNAIQWLDDSLHAFSTIKEFMAQAPELALPDFSFPIVVECDAEYKNGSHIDARRKGHCIFQ